MSSRTSLLIGDMPVLLISLWCVLRRSSRCAVGLLLSGKWYIWLLFNSIIYVLQAFISKMCVFVLPLLSPVSTPVGTPVSTSISTPVSTSISTPVSTPAATTRHTLNVCFCFYSYLFSTCGPLKH